MFWQCMSSVLFFTGSLWDAAKCGQRHCSLRPLLYSGLLKLLPPFPFSLSTNPPSLMHRSSQSVCFPLPCLEFLICLYLTEKCLIFPFLSNQNKWRHVIPALMRYSTKKLFRILKTSLLHRNMLFRNQLTVYNKSISQIFTVYLLQRTNLKTLLLKS